MPREKIIVKARPKKESFQLYLYGDQWDALDVLRGKATRNDLIAAMIAHHTERGTVFEFEGKKA